MAEKMSEFERAMLEETRAHNARVLAAMAPAAKPFDGAPPNEQFAAMMAERRGQNLPPIPIEEVPAKSLDTGATFVAKIQRGIVIDLLDYKFPEGIDVHQASGGLVPDGKQIRDERGQKTPDYNQWVWTEFRQRDIRAFVSRPLPSYAKVG